MAPADPSEDRGVQWMLAFQRGDRAAFGRIVEEYQSTVFALLRRLLGPCGELEDSAQEVFLRLYRARDRYHPGGKLSTFLYRITYNLALNRIRDGRRHRTQSLSESSDGSPVEVPEEGVAQPWEAVDRKDWAAQVSAALAQLPENQRAALVFQHYEGLGLEDIGELLGISAKAAKSLLHRARSRMRELLAPFREAENER